MSKYLVKILSICAFIILLPLVIVGSALCVTEAIGVRVTVAAAGIENEEGLATSNVSIYLDGEKQEGTTIVVKKNTELTVTYEGEGYDFQGWYNGNYSEINREKAKAVSDKESYSFTVRANTVLTAVRDIKTYTVTYTGKLADGATDVDLPNENLSYGQDLATLADPDGVYVLKGWRYVPNSEEPENTVTTKVANFATSGEYTVEANWIDQTAVEYTLHVQYHAKSTETQDVTFSIASGFGEYRTRTGYTLDGYKVGETVYNNESADYAGLVAAANDNNEINAVAVWTCNQAAFNLSIEGDIYVYTNEEHTNDAFVDTASVNFNDTENGLDLTDDVFEWFKAQLNTTEFYNNTGAQVGWNGQYTLTVGGTPIDKTYNAVSGDEIALTFETLIAKLNADYVGTWSNQVISIEFTFVAA